MKSKPKSMCTFKNCSHVCVHITVHTCRTQHSTEQFWLFSLVMSQKSSQLRCWNEESQYQVPDRQWPTELLGRRFSRHRRYSCDTRDCHSQQRVEYQDWVDSTHLLALSQNFCQDELCTCQISPWDHLPLDQQSEHRQNQHGGLHNLLARMHRTSINIFQWHSTGSRKILLLSRCVLGYLAKADQH